MKIYFDQKSFINNFKIILKRFPVTCHWSKFCLFLCLPQSVSDGDIYRTSHLHFPPDSIPFLIRNYEPVSQQIPYELPCQKVTLCTPSLCQRGASISSKRETAGAVQFSSVTASQLHGYRPALLPAHAELFTGEDDTVGLLGHYCYKRLP